MCRRPCALTSLLAIALAAGCGSVSGSPDGGGGAGGQAGGTGGRGGTGGGSSGGTGGGSGGGAGGVCVFASTYTVVDGMGLAGSETATLTPPDSFHLQRDTRVADGGLRSCDAALPACGDPGHIDVGDVEAAIANPDVQAALALPAPNIYGQLNVADGPTLTFSDAAGHGFGTMLACNNQSATCRPIPPGVDALAALLRALIAQEKQDLACAAP